MLGKGWKMSLTENTKRQWIDKYASRIIQLWHAQDSPLGIDHNYTHQVKTQLEDYYDDPFKRSLIETSY